MKRFENQNYQRITWKIFKILLQGVHTKASIEKALLSISY